MLFHGTIERFLASITEHGLQPGQRQFVHLSADVPTALRVGVRRSRPIVLRIDATGLHATGHPFYQAANGVWLTPHVPPQWLHPATDRQ